MGGDADSPEIETRLLHSTYGSDAAASQRSRRSTMSNAWLDARRREEEWQIRLLRGKDLPTGDEGLPAPQCRLVVTAGLRWPAGHSNPFFSVTAELVDRTKHRGDMVIRTGPQHERVLKYFPEFEPVVRLHSLDVDAVPEQEASRAINLLLELGAKDYRVATSAQRALTDRLDRMERDQPSEPPGIGD